LVLGGGLSLLTKETRQIGQPTALDRQEKIGEPLDINACARNYMGMTIDHTQTDSLDRALAWRITRAARLLRQHLARTLRPVGVTPEQFYLLFRLHETDGATQADLVDKTLADRPNVSRLLAGMERAGWVTRRPDPDDKRARRVFLTDAGRERVAVLLELAVQERVRLFGGLDAEQLQLLDHTLTTLESRLTADDA
jgi:MarR family transcriptional regulator for hemolysin